MATQQSIIGTGDITRILSILRKNWWIAVAITGLGFGLGFFVTYKLTNIYGASTQILLRTNDDIKQGSLISDNPYYGNVMKTYVDNSNEKRILASYDLIKETVERMKIDVSYYIVGRIRTEEVFQGVPFSVIVGELSGDLYEQQMAFKILNEKEFNLKYIRNGTEQEVVGQFGKDLNNSDMHLLVTAPSPQVISQGLESVNYLVQIHTVPSLVARYQSTIKVESPEYTNILAVSIEDVIAERGVKFLDTLIQVYIENSIQQRLDVNQNTVFYIDRQLNEVTGILNNIEDTLQRFRENNVIINLDDEGEQFFTQYMQFDNRKRGLQIQAEALNDLEDYIRQNKDPQFLPPSAYFSFGDEFLDKSVAQLYTLQISYQNEQATATVNNPELIILDSNIQRQRRMMLTYIGNNRLAIIENIKSTELQVDTSIMRLQNIPIKQRGLVNINRDLHVNENMYIFLLQKRATTIIARAGILPETQIIERARSMGIVKPNRNLITYYFAGGGFILALLIIFIRIIFFGKIESFDELKSVTHLPVIGEVINTPLAQDLKLIVDSDPKSPVAESFRTIRTNLQYMLGDKQKGSIVVTSNNPGEGKTFCSINLAGILAKGGKKTILLELDLHKPRVHKGLGIEHKLGFSTIAIGKSTIEECIIPTGVENLDAILSGPLPPNPSEIVVSKTLDDVLNYCKEHYEFIIIDTPPVGLITDALVLMKVVDVTLFVINTKFVYRNSVNTAHEIVEMNKLGRFGFILNGVKRKKSKYYYNRYAYGYSYGSYGDGYGSYRSYGGYGSSNSPKKTKKNEA
jgi:tyrosine-protein kinase Etk/Wzc